MQTSLAGLRAFIWILLIVFGAVIFMMKSYAIAILMGSLLAMLSFPLHRKLRRRVKPSISAGLITLLVILLAAGPLLTFAGLAIKQGVAVAEQLAEAETFSFEKVSLAVEKSEFLEEFFKGKDIEGEVEKGLQTAGKAASKAVLIFAKNLPQGIIKFFLAGVTCFFFLVDGPRFLKWSYARLPLAGDVRENLISAFADTAISVVWATMTAAGAQALIMTLTFLILKVPAAFFAGGVTFIFAFVPFIGSVPVWTGATIYLFFTGSPIKALIMLCLGVFTALIDNVVRPWVLKGRNEMHPLVALLAIIGGIETLGLAGVFLGPILAALLISLLQIWPMIGHRYGLDFGSGFLKM